MKEIRLGKASSVFLAVLLAGASALADFCPKCGTEHAEDAQFCSKCGYKLKPSDKIGPSVDQNVNQNVTQNQTVVINIQGDTIKPETLKEKAEQHRISPIYEETIELTPDLNDESETPIDRVSLPGLDAFKFSVTHSCKNWRALFGRPDPAETELRWKLESTDGSTGDESKVIWRKQPAYRIQVGRMLVSQGQRFKVVFIPTDVKAWNEAVYGNEAISRFRIRGVLHVYPPNVTFTGLRRSDE